MQGFGIHKGELFVALGVIITLLVMLFPMPPIVLDLLLSFNITFSLIILLVSLYTIRPIEFFIFPSLLLVTTLFRLSLNVASTRLILLHGYEGMDAAGRVIRSFGSFVVGGNYVVGGIIFLILVVINFIVIIKGSTRIAEVAARFTLDAMPGKQMSIDADLNAGYIDDMEARKRRANLSREGEFYGAMDGASKFVRGEAMAGILILAINILGGLIIGVAQHDMTIADAAQTFSLLTIGEGLVGQIPALLVSTAAGLVVSKAASEATLGDEYAAQFTLKPQAMSVAAGIILLIGLVPGLPHLPFIALALMTGGLSYVAYTSRQKTETAEAEAKKVPKPRGPEPMENLLSLDLLELEAGYGLIPMVDEEQDGELLERIRALRRQFVLEMGVIVPPIHIRDNLQLKPGGYRVIIKGVEVAQGDMMVGYQLALHPGDALRQIEGIPTREPTFNLPALWIPANKKEEAQHLGYTVVNLSSVIATHLSEVIRIHCHELLGRQEVQKLMDRLAQTNPKVVEELVPGLLSLGAIQKVLQNLVQERVSIRDLLTILETLADYAPYTKDPDILTEYVRQRLGRALTKPLETPDNKISVFSLDPFIEDLIKDSLQKTDYGVFLAMAPETAQEIITALQEAVDKATAQNLQPIVVCSPGVRRHLRRLVEKHLPTLRVLSHHELVTEAKIQSLGVVSLSHEA
ncbi:MAG: flagellar biosynthesis protein FlhA [Deltaproteobacteria bacterium RBG_13_60_28]|nr:MAG: flagellar biosynthesis protein FlhA [Deltaproteobacteria bacterium RBG_13_60_28]